ncbi:unnamed protein product [Adineta steineri]|uniref:NmrA-like family domain-containing protein 1 n=2 Tax=Adineta steineri TaxID=433720 RepID=A0A813X082_9BILA|nr:unnamed protein product [Adineta steineri]CAF0953165.1 unnamed protein product [Adineta steineri]CAF3829730.1 unnamed protein product [Adineta steineri]
MPRIIAVVGAIGRQSMSVIEALLEYPDKWHIRGITDDLTSFYNQELVRRGVNMVKCNINNHEECCQAFTGAYGVFAITSYWNATDHDEYKQAVTLVEAARAVNVQHFIISILPNAGVLENKQSSLHQHFMNKTQIENYIRQLPTDNTFTHTTFVHVGFYYQNFATFFVPNVANLQFRYPILPHARIPFYDVRDTGKIVRECFQYPDRWGNAQIVPIVAEQLTMKRICTTIQQVTGKHVNFVPLSYEDALLKLHQETINNLRWYNDIGSNDEYQVEKTKEIWSKMRTFADWLRETRWLME